jgi:signal peptidase I
MEAVEQPNSRTKSALRELVETVLLTLLIYALVRSFLFENYRVVGRSMIPTLEDDQYLAVNKLDYRLHEPQRGDIIVFRDPSSDERKLIKRVIGLSGELIEIREGQVYINSQPLDEPYIEAPPRYFYPPTQVPEGQYFVMGDNRNNSSDSHNWGTLPRDMIVGKAWVSYWPPRLWGIIPHETYGNMP